MRWSGGGGLIPSPAWSSSITASARGFTPGTKARKLLRADRRETVPRTPRFLRSGGGADRGVEQRADRFRAHRAIEVEALRELAFQRDEFLCLAFGLDALGDDVDPVGLRELDQHAHDRRAAEAAVGALDERAIDLERVERELVQVAQR